MVAVISKKRHSLQGLNLVKLIKRIRVGKIYLVDELASFQKGKPVADLSVQEFKNAFQEILLSEESLEDVLQMAGRAVNLDNCRFAVHEAVCFANEYGQPKGQQLHDSLASGSKDEGETDSQLPTKSLKLERRIEDLEKSKTESVQRLKAKVRSLALQQEPSEALLLLTLDELANVARQTSNDEAETLDELARQASRYQGKINIQSLCLSVLGGSAGDRVSKALLKCVKEKASETSVTHKDKDPPPQSSQPMYPHFMAYQAPVMPGYSNSSFVYGYTQPRYSRPFGQSRRGSQRTLTCLFCDNPAHMVKDCELMGKAKSKK